MIINAAKIVTQSGRQPSANFTEGAQERNVEAGASIRSRPFAVQQRSQTQNLIQTKPVRRLLDSRVPY